MTGSSRGLPSKAQVFAWKVLDTVRRFSISPRVCVVTARSSRISALSMAIWSCAPVSRRSRKGETTLRGISGLMERMSSTCCGGRMSPCSQRSSTCFTSSQRSSSSSQSSSSLPSTPAPPAAASFMEASTASRSTRLQRSGRPRPARRQSLICAARSPSSACAWSTSSVSRSRSSSSSWPRRNCAICVMTSAWFASYMHSGSSSRSRIFFADQVLASPLLCSQRPR
mmetsp:Transcript_39456/g.123464  ORF Transcript_39456/g.123464 Transcript_39456/m.123464 type:complete len:226 (-) Transcript_39456:517-1194(-)